MSSPDTNLEKQKRRHAAPLRGIIAAVGFAVALLAGLLIWTVSDGGEPEGADTQVDGRTGTVVETN